jgi:fluoride ion exporter CrcB/FEX
MSLDTGGQQLRAAAEAAAEGGKAALHRFFYPRDKDLAAERSPSRTSPKRHRRHRQHVRVPTDTATEAELDVPDLDPLSTAEDDQRIAEQPDDEPPSTPTPEQIRQQQLLKEQQQELEEDEVFVHRFWTAYDDILILSIFTQLGIVFRLASSTWFTIFDDVFSNDSPLFVNLPLNCLSCFLMGLFCSGERLMQIIMTRFSPPRLQHEMQDRLRDDSEPSEAFADDEDENDALLEGDGVVTDETGGFSSPSSAEGFGPENNDHRWLRRRRRRRRRQKKQKYFHHWQPPIHLNDDLRDVQLLALERRIRMSKCLLLFPVRKEDIDVMEHYFDEGYKRHRHDSSFEEGEENLHHVAHQDGDEYGLEMQVQSTPRRRQHQRVSFDLKLKEEVDTGQSDRRDEMSEAESGATSPERNHKSPAAGERHTSSSAAAVQQLPSNGHENNRREPPFSPPGDRLANASPTTAEEKSDEDDGEENGPQGDLDQMISEVTTNVRENVSRLRRVNLADGWDAGTTPEAMSDDLLLGLRDGFCGAVSSFSSWNSAMVNLMKAGQIGQAFVGYMLGLQLPIIAYRFGQHVAVYIFIWRTRREARGDERRGYGIRLSMDESERDVEDENRESEHKKDEREIPSVRAIVTAIFIMALVTQCTSLSFFTDPQNQQLALSLLFSPLGVLARWRLSKYNSWRPSFPIGTFTANILACALSGSLGSLLAGNPNDEERVILVSLIAGFGGTLSSLAAFVVEVLAGIDPMLFRFDGVFYAVTSIACALVAVFVFSASVDWADRTVSDEDMSAGDATIAPSLAPSLMPSFAPTLASSTS